MSDETTDICYKLIGQQVRRLDTNVEKMRWYIKRQFNKPNLRSLSVDELKLLVKMLQSMKTWDDSNKPYGLLAKLKGVFPQKKWSILRQQYKSFLIAFMCGGWDFKNGCCTFENEGQWQHYKFITGERQYWEYRSVYDIDPLDEIRL